MDIKKYNNNTHYEFLIQTQHRQIKNWDSQNLLNDTLVYNKYMHIHFIFNKFSQVK